MALELSNKSKQIGKDIEHVLQEIKKKDALIRQLNDERAELSIRYEELKAERQTCLSESLASERDWENGNRDFASARYIDYDLNSNYSFQIPSLGLLR